MNLSDRLRAERDPIRQYAIDYGLDFFEVIFEEVDFDQMNEIASYGGFPTRYPHWRFGMQYEEMSKGYAYGLHKIYEMVINNDPSYAYLLKSNQVVDQKIVMAHVYGHSDFFKNNMWFSKTNRKMMDDMANHGMRVRRYMDRHGVETVEDFIDACLSIDNLIDPHAPFIRRQGSTAEQPPSDHERETEHEITRLKSSDYMDRYINPPEFLQSQRESAVKKQEAEQHFPVEPQRDIMQFLLDYAPLSRWQRDVLGILREEAYYFAPQGQTKIMNEGWASYWHSKIMTTKALEPDELIDYADHHSGTLGSSPGSLNPYKLGIELFKDIEDRWNKGKFGPDYDRCDDIAEKKTWDKNLGLGREKIFEVRRIYNDVSFIDTYLTPEFCVDHKMFTYEFDPHTRQYYIDERKFDMVKQKLLFQLTNFGQPFIDVTDGNYLNRGELYLAHQHEGADMRIDYAKAVLVNVERIWQRPANLETVVDGQKKLFSYDGKEHNEKNLA